METRSGEILSAGIAMAMAVSTLSWPDSVIFRILDYSNFTYLWGFVAMTSSLVCFYSVLCSHERLAFFARTMSGCLWLTLIVAFMARAYPAPMFWSSLVMFIFDVFVVTQKGGVWTQKIRH